MDDHIQLGLPKLRLHQLVPLDGAEVAKHQPPAELENHLPPTEAENNLPLTKVRNRPPLAEVANQPPQGVQLDCPQGQKEVVIPSHVINGLSKNSERKPVNEEVFPTLLDPHWPGGRQLAKSTSMRPTEICLPAMLPQRQFGPAI